MGKKWSKAARQAQSERMKAKWSKTKGAVVLSDTPKAKSPKYDTVMAFGLDLDELAQAANELAAAILKVKNLLDGK